MPLPYPCEVMDAQAAFERFRDLRIQGEGTVVILGGPDQLERMTENFELDSTTPEALIAQAVALDPLEWLAQREQQDPEYYEVAAGDWPEDTEPNNSISSLIDFETGEPRQEVALTVLPTRDAWTAACYLKTGGWNEMPEPHEHAALWRYWEQRYGAQVACIADDVIELTVDRPPQTREEALALARQQFIYCADIVHQGTGSLEALAATLLDGSVWFFWWD